MAKKNRETHPKEVEIGINLGNPFADLKVDVPPPPEPPKPAPPPPPTKEELQEAALSDADKALLEKFRASGSTSIIINEKKQVLSAGPTLTLVIQRKGHKGKTVTLIHGFKETATGDRMELCSQLKTALGIGARFVDAVLELQGDQRQRAALWLENKGFKCNIPK